MKKNLVFLLMAFLTLNFVACSDDDDNDPVTIEGRGFNIDQTLTSSTCHPKIIFK